MNTITFRDLLLVIFFAICFCAGVLLASCAHAGQVTLRDYLKDRTVYVTIPGVKSGTGWCAGKHTIITNHHVVKDENTPGAIHTLITATDYDGNVDLVKAVTVYNEIYDVAVMTVPNICANKWLHFADEDPESGSFIATMGNPLSVTYQYFEGRVAGVDGTSITINIMLAPGSSGSPIVNAYGEVVGMIWGGFVGYPGWGLMVPSSIIKQVLNGSIDG